MSSGDFPHARRIALPHGEEHAVRRRGVARRVGKLERTGREAHVEAFRDRPPAPAAIRASTPSDCGFGGRADHVSTRRTGAGSNTMPSFAKLAMNAARIPCSNPMRANASSASTSERSALSSGSPSCACAGSVAAAVAASTRNVAMVRARSVRRKVVMRASIISCFCAVFMRSRRFLRAPRSGAIRPCGGSAGSFARAVALLVAAFHLSTAAFAQAPAAVAAPVAAPTPPSVAAPAWLAARHAVRADRSPAQSADERRDPASLTKLMTAYLVFGALRAKTITPSQMVNVSRTAWKAEGSRMFIEPRKAVSVDELAARHDRAVGQRRVDRARRARGRQRGGVRRAEMNAEAARLGLKDTHFANATGLVRPAALLDAPPTSRRSPRR